jgi:outer membrane cobalamin receptor
MMNHPINARLLSMGWAMGMALGAATAVQAADTGLEEVIVTGTRIYDAPEHLPFATTVVDRAAIEARNDVSMVDLLRSLPGVQVTQPGGGGGVASVFLRGGEPNFTVVFVDGVKVNDPNNTRGGSFDFATLTLGDVERVELVRGPQSAVYGSDALSGVINVITRGRSDAWGTSLEAEGGTRSWQNGAVSVSGPLMARGGLTLRAQRIDQGDTVQGGSFDSNSFQAKLVLDNAGPWRATLHGHYADSQGTAYPEDSGGPLLAKRSLRDTKDAQDLVLGSEGGVKMSQNWTLNLAANWYDHKDDSNTPGVLAGVRPSLPARGAKSELKREYATVSTLVTLGESARATFGADYQKEQGNSIGYIRFSPFFSLPANFSIERKTTGAFLETQYTGIKGLTLLGSVRHDDPNGSEAHTTAKAGALYAFNDNTTRLRLNWGQGFKLPSFFALAYPLTASPLLRPETSRSVEAGVTQSFAGGAQASLSVFDNRFTDLIDFDVQKFKFVNRSVVTARGAELEFDFPASSSLRFGVHTTYVDINVKDSDVPLRQRPDWSGGLTARWQVMPMVAMQASLLYIGDTFDTSVPTGSLTLPAYNRVDVNTSWTVSPKLTMDLAVDNLFDHRYAEAIGFPASGITARMKARYRF